MLQVDDDTFTVSAGGFVSGSILNVTPRIHVDDGRCIRNHHPLLRDVDIHHQVMTYIDSLEDVDYELYSSYQKCIHGISSADLKYELRIENTVTFTPPPSTGIGKYTVAACRNYYSHRPVHATGNA